VTKSAQLLTELAARAPSEGPNIGLWPGLTIYRFSRPAPPRWCESGPLSIAIGAQGNTTGYTVIRGGRDFDCYAVEASPHDPVLCFVLHVDPQLVRAVSSSMRGLGARPSEAERHVVSVVDNELAATVSRFLGSLSSSCDRRVLAPLHLQEMMYRLLQREQSGRLVQLAEQQAIANPVAAALDYIAAHLAEPLTVDILAAQVWLSPSAFTRVFRQRTGRSPYQYVKETRLDWARQLLADKRGGVAEASRTVGYSSVSHFIKEFRIRFGATPGDYAYAQTRLAS
jgi:AraC-like DNA-binding protein